MIKNKKILTAKGQANMAFIKALYKERGGYKPTKNEMRKFEFMNVKDVMSLILGKGAVKQLINQPEAQIKQPDPLQGPTINPEAPIAPAPIVPAPIPDQVAQLLQPAQPVPPTFDQSGLFNEADVAAQGEAEYSPYFSNALADLVKGYGRKGQDLKFGQGQQTQGQISDYLNRGLSRSGGFLGAQQQLGQQQGLATQDLLDEEGRKKKELAQQKAGALQDYRQTAYQNAYSKYLNR